MGPEGTLGRYVALGRALDWRWRPCWVRGRLEGEHWVVVGRLDRNGLCWDSVAGELRIELLVLNPTVLPSFVSHPESI